ncbi:MAG: GTP cyclohydrolase II RibA [Candidatus Methanohalarchaeum thermophilum]|uniref:GTP cyclohydrolase-2 n=1 Tax=Methanohalarchaeum thermophilum TaxID=1903181 RepID=A0A1Q6DVL3_METT1|nr:MAG: GTP cyclohydrolase II RibA [Candidatus Methanohalarchaeum thermophilum]
MEKLSHDVSVRLPTEFGKFRLYLYTDKDGREHLALVMGDIEGREDVLTRVHSQCMTGDLFGSLRCDCHSQFELSKEIIAEEGEGILIYLRQEGRGIGLESKLKSYNLQDQGYDTVDANKALGFEADMRDYEVASLILKDLGVKSIRLLSNNPDKLDSLKENGIKVSDRIPIYPKITEENYDYIKTKEDKMDHLLNIDALSPFMNKIQKICSYFNKQIEKNNELRIAGFFVQGINGNIPSYSNLNKDKNLEAIYSRLISCYDAHIPDNNLNLYDSFTDKEEGPSKVVNNRDNGELSNLDEKTKIIEESKVKENKSVVDQLEKKDINSVLIQSKDVLNELMEKRSIDFFITFLIPKMFPKEVDKLSINKKDFKPRRARDIHSIKLGDNIIYYGCLGEHD